MNNTSPLFFLLRLLALAFTVGGIASPASAKTYSDNGNGTVTDSTTGLIWMRCSMGQAWTGSTCTGTASTYTWDQSNALTGTVSFGGRSDWRMPNIRELQTIVDRTRYNLAIDPTAFPNSPSPSYFWSSSVFIDDSGRAWYVDFYQGFAFVQSRYYDGPVRLVRSGQSLATLLNLARPTTDYTDNGDGTVTHNPTGLIWQRCAKGQTWTDSTCSGSATIFSLSAAVAITDSFAAQTDWRLPTEDELLSLVDYTRYGPAINTAIFPNTSPLFWSVTAGSGGVGAWEVIFYNGNADVGGSNNPNRVRLVRAGQTNGTFALSATFSGVGSGSVISSPSSINCVAACSRSFTIGTSVMLTATPATGSTFAGWSGDCTGTGTCTVTMDAAKNAKATFDLAINAINFGAAPAVIVGGTGAGTLSATATSGLAVTFSSLTPSICTVIGNAVTGISAGTCIVAADQAGDANYNAATQVTQNISIGNALPTGTTLNLTQGWNLVGNSVDAPLTVATTFSDTTKILSVWSWVVTKAKWAFFNPALVGQALTDYASSRGYDVLTTINGGEGFWVNAKTAFSVQLPAGTVVASSSFQSMSSGWHLISTGSTKTPSGFNTDMSMSPPTAGMVPQNFATLWAWDSAQSKWYFYSPSLEAQGGTALPDYISSRGYRDFTSANKSLEAGVGFWVNKP
ncbi:MAG: DUF1566 domain-containing protein [Proteobacteria bacterium]|nr:DUF1566 domain-containing protein [Pseudomonadota bacterium]